MAIRILVHVGLREAEAVRSLAFELSSWTSMSPGSDGSAGCSVRRAL